MARRDRTTDEADGGSKPPVGALHRRAGSSAAMDKAVSDEPDATGKGLEKYLIDLTHLDMALPLKIELIRSMRAIMQSFVDRAFGDDPVQLAGKSGRNKSDTGAHADVLPSSLDTPNHHENLTSGFRRIAEPCEEKETGR